MGADLERARFRDLARRTTTNATTSRNSQPARTAIDPDALEVEATHGCTPSPTCAFDQVRQDRSVAASVTAARVLRRPSIVRFWRWWLLRAEPVPQLPEHYEHHDDDDQNAAGYPPGDAHITEITVLRTAGDSVSRCSIRWPPAPTRSSDQRTRETPLPLPSRRRPVYATSTTAADPPHEHGPDSEAGADIVCDGADPRAEEQRLCAVGADLAAGDGFFEVGPYATPTVRARPAGQAHLSSSSFPGPKGAPTTSEYVVPSPGSVREGSYVPPAPRPGTGLRRPGLLALDPDAPEARPALADPGETHRRSPRRTRNTPTAALTKQTSMRAGTRPDQPLSDGSGNPPMLQPAAITRIARKPMPAS